MTIDQAKKFFELLFNKYQVGGYTSPSEFNLLAARAQMELYLERFGNPNKYTPGTATAQQNNTISGKIEDDLKIFLTNQFINLTKKTFYAEGGLPSDYQDYSDSRVDADNPSPIKFIDSDKLNSRLKSKIVPPTYEYPIGVMYGTNVRIYPNTVLGFNLTYYRTPKNPIWNYTVVGGQPVYNPTGSVDFEMPDSCHNEIIIKMLSYKGISLRENELYNYSVQKDNTGV